MFRFDEPVLVIDEEKTRKNIGKIAKKTKVAGNIFRPHFKTHQSAVVGEWFKDEGVESITVSSIKMAEYFASRGWKDILIAFLYIPSSIDRLNSLASKCRISVLVDHPDPLNHLIEKIRHPIGVWIKVDCGYSRTGIPLKETGKITQLVQITSSKDIVKFEGLLTHAGHSYSTCSLEELEALFARSRSRMEEAGAKVSEETNAEVKLSWGDTPTCSIVKSLKGFQEIRCGNFVFYDLMQHLLKSCRTDEISATLFSPVVGLYPERGEIVIQGGAVHLSKEYLIDKNGTSIYGMIGLIDQNNRWSEPINKTFIRSLSQEHGIISTTREVIEEIRHGDMVAVYPVHSCLTANLANSYLSTKGQIIENINTSR